MLGRLSGRSRTQAQVNFAELVEWEREAVDEIARLAVEASLSYFTLTLAVAVSRDL